MKIKNIPSAKLSNKQINFVQEYLKDFNATQSAIRAGYPEDSARSTANYILKRLEAQNIIQEAMTKRFEQTKIDKNFILTELHRIASADIGHAFDKDGCLLPIHSIPENVRRAISSIEVDEIWDWEDDGQGGRKKVCIGLTKKVKFWEKTKSLETLGKHLALWIEKLEHSGEINIIYGHRRPKEGEGK